MFINIVKLIFEQYLIWISFRKIKNFQFYQMKIDSNDAENFSVVEIFFESLAYGKFIHSRKLDTIQFTYYLERLRIDISRGSVF